MSVNYRFQMRHDTAAAWTAANPTLLAGEFGFETDTLKLKCGDGVTAWNSLAYIGGSSLTYVGPWPAAPTAVTPTTYATSITWTWSVPTGIPTPDGYILWISTDPTFASGVTVVDRTGNTSTTYTQTGATYGTTYYAVVAGVFNKSAGPFSSSGSIAPRTPLPRPGIMARLDPKFFPIGP